MSQSASPSRVREVMSRHGLSEALVLGQTASGEQDQNRSLRVIANPWPEQKREERLERAYALSSALMTRLEARAGVSLARWGIADALRHELMYFCLEDWVQGQLEADEAKGALDGGARPGQRIYAMTASGLRGLAFSAALGDEATELAAETPPSPAPHAARTAQIRRLAENLIAPPWRPPEVLVVAVYDNRLRKLAELIERLRDEGWSVGGLSLATQRVRPELLEAAAREMQLPLLRWEALLRSTKLGRLLQRQMRLEWSARRGLPSYVTEALGVASHSRHWPRVLAALLRQCRISGLRMLLVRELLLAALRRRPPRLVLTMRGDDTILRVLGATANALGVPVLDVQHGLRCGVPPVLHRDVRGVDFALYGEGAVAAYRAAGVPERRLHAVGSADFDALGERSLEPLPDGIRPPFVLYSSSAATVHKRWEMTALHDDILRALDAYLSRRREDRVVVKLHPQEYDDRTARFIDELDHRGRFHVIKSAANPPLFAAARAQVSAGSTSSIEAALMGTPVVVVDDGRAAGYFSQAYACKAATQVTRPDALTDVLERLPDAPGHREVDPDLVRFYAHRLDGHSLDRILEIPVVRAALTR